MSPLDVSRVTAKTEKKNNNLRTQIISTDDWIRSKRIMFEAGPWADNDSRFI